MKIVIDNVEQLAMWETQGIHRTDLEILKKEKPDDDAEYEKYMKIQERVLVLKLKNLNRCLYYIQNDDNFESKRSLAEACVQRMNSLFEELEGEGGLMGAEVFSTDDTADFSVLLRGKDFVPLLNVAQSRGMLDMLGMLGRGMEARNMQEAYSKICEAPNASTKKPSKNSSKFSKFSLDFEKTLLNNGAINTTYSSNGLAKAILCAHFKLEKHQIPFTNESDVTDHMDGNSLIAVGRAGYRMSSKYFAHLRYDEASHSFKLYDRCSLKGTHALVDEKHGLGWLSDGKHGITAYKLDDLSGKDKPTPICSINLRSGALLRLNNDLLSFGNGEVNVWDVSNLSSIDTSTKSSFELFAEDDQVNQLLPYHDNTIFATRFREHTFHTIDLHQQCMDRVFYGHQFAVNQLSCVKSEPHIVMSVSSDGTAKIWDARQYHCTYTLLTGEKYLYGGAICSLDGTYYAFVGGENQSILAFDMRMGMCAYEMATGNADVKSLYWHDASSSLVTRCLHNTFTGKPMNEMDLDEDVYSSDDNENQDNSGPWRYSLHRRYHFDAVWHEQYGFYGIYSFDRTLPFETPILPHTAPASKRKRSK